MDAGMLQLYYDIVVLSMSINDRHKMISPVETQCYQGKYAYLEDYGIARQ